MKKYQEISRNNQMPDTNADIPIADLLFNRTSRRMKTRGIVPLCLSSLIFFSLCFQTFAQKVEKRKPDVKQTAVPGSSTAYPAITIQGSDISLNDALEQIKSQTNHTTFIDPGALELSKNMTLVLKNTQVNEALKIIFSLQPGLHFILESKTIVIKLN